MQAFGEHYGTKAIILIDEYDFPLQKAFVNGYYEQMVSLIRGLFSDAFKTNDNLEFAVLTGYLRIAKESIFTVMNNLRVYSIKDVRFRQYFGFTDGEVLTLLDYYGRSESYDVAKNWYDVYLFGGMEIYCLWDVLNYCDDLLDSPNARPEDYWINTDRAW